MKGYLKTYRINGVKGYDPKNFISSIKPKVIELIKQKKKPIKLKFLFTCAFQKENPATGQIDINTGYFHSLVETITESSDLSDIFNAMTDIIYILEKVQQFQNKGSGWQFENIESFDIFLDPFQPLDGSVFSMRHSWGLIGTLACCFARWGGGFMRISAFILPAGVGD